MNIAMSLPSPLNSFQLDVPANRYYDFEVPASRNYPLRGVTYPVDYGHTPSHTAEDGHELDLFVGNSANGLCGAIIVDRGESIPNEKKFYVALAAQELHKI